MDTAFPAVDEFGTLIDVLLAGDHAAALVETQRLIQAGHPAEKIVTAGLETAMRRLDDKCTVESFNLLEIMLVGRAVSAVVHELYPEGVPPENSRGTLIVATLEGDVHDLGKNIVKMLLDNYGYTVFDLGRDVDPQEVLKTVRERDIKLVGLSALMTTTVVAMEETIKLLHAEVPGVKIIVGGAVLTPEYAKQIGADYYAKDAAESARIAEEVFGQ